MIFVTVGTQAAPFDRLMRALGDLPPGEEIVVQCGSSKIRPPRATCVDFMPFADVLEHVRNARAVVAHAGVGSVMICLENGKRPIVVPRLEHLGEHPDDHQHEFARRLEAQGLVTVVEDLAHLPAVLSNQRELSIPPAARGGQLVGELRRYLGVHLGLAERGVEAPAESLERQIPSV